MDAASQLLNGPATQVSDASGVLPAVGMDSQSSAVSDAELDEADAIIARLLVADWRRRKQQERETDP